jgi:hypothetical protein
LRLSLAEYDAFCANLSTKHHDWIYNVGTFMPNQGGRIMKSYIFIVLTTFMIYFTVFSAKPAFAGDQDKPYLCRMSYRIVRGVTNIGLGWTEIVLRPLVKHKMESTPQSLATANANAAKRLTAGAADILTFWVPGSPNCKWYPMMKDWPFILQGS